MTEINKAVNATFSHRRDVGDGLPQQVREKLERLRDERAIAHSALRVFSDKAAEKAHDIEQVQRRIAELKSHYNLPDNDPHVLAERESLKNLRAAQSKFQEEVDVHTAIWSPQSRLVQHLEDYLQRLGNRSCAAADPWPMPKLGRNETRADAVARLRGELMALREEIHIAQHAPITAEAAKKIVRNQLDQIAEAGRPDVFRAIEGRRPLQFPQIQLRNDELVDAFSVIVWTFKSDIFNRIASEIDQNADDASALTDEERANKVKKLKLDALRLQRDEEAMIVAAAVEGQIIIRRPDADPRAVFGLAEEMPEAR